MRSRVYSLPRYAEIAENMKILSDLGALGG